MTTIQIYDSVLCGGTDACGRNTDKAMMTFTLDVDWARQHGARIELFSLARQPAAFSESRIVRDFLGQSGAESLPLTLVNGETALSGRYPKRAELAHWAGITPHHRMLACSCCGGQAH